MAVAEHFLFYLAVIVFLQLLVVDTLKTIFIVGAQHMKIILFFVLNILAVVMCEFHLWLRKVSTVCFFIRRTFSDLMTSDMRTTSNLT